MKKAVIVSGGAVDEEFVLKVLETENWDYRIGADRGLLFFYEHQKEPTHIVGDFDSVPKEVISFYKEKKQIPIYEFNPVKDATDTEIAVRKAMELGSEYIVLLGATGTRIDHVLANIQTLAVPYESGVGACMQDAHNRIRLISGETRIRRDEQFGTCFSLFPLEGDVEHVSVEGAKYPLCDYTITARNSLCVSNEIAGEEVVITCPKDKILILIESRDE